MAGLVLGVLAAAACTPSVGDKCTLSTDCSVRGDRLCDTSQPGGYCTVFNCRGNACPADATCVLFYPAVPGCGVSDRSISRAARTFCASTCVTDADCRTDQGYACTDPRLPPWGALILDDIQTQKVCMVRPTTDAGPDPVVRPDAAVCSAAGEPVADIDASPGRIEVLDGGRRLRDGGGGAGDAGDAGADAERDAASD